MLISRKLEQLFKVMPSRFYHENISVVLSMSNESTAFSKDIKAFIKFVASKKIIL